MIFRHIYIVIFTLLFSFNSVLGQPAGCPTSSSANCDGWPLSKLDLDQQGGGSVLEFVFDQISEYESGVTYYGTSILRVTASDTAGSGNCAWKLYMIANNGGAPTPATEWNQLSAYGSAGSQPTIALMDVRVTNNCATSQNNGQWQTFQLAQNGGVIEIIDDGAFVNVAGIGGCSGNGEVNSAGSYLTSYGEFAFVIDYRIRPFFNYAPGKYELNIKFCLRE